METSTKILDYLKENGVNVDPAAGPDAPLGLDSLNIVKLVSFLEQDFEVSIDDEELVPENFGTLGQVVGLVEKKKVSESVS